MSDGLCDLCEDEKATLQCDACDQALCPSCDVGQSSVFLREREKAKIAIRVRFLTSHRLLFHHQTYTSLLNFKVISVFQSASLLLLLLPLPNLLLLLRPLLPQP